MSRVALLVLLVACGGGGKPGAQTAPPPANHPHTDAELQAGCDAKQVPACMELGERYGEGEGDVEVDLPRAGTLFERACELGSQDGCARFAIGIAHGNYPGDVTRAYALLDTACTRGEVRGCRGVGYLKLEGRGTTRDLPGALTILTKACGDSDGTACGILAVLYLNEQQDQARATQAATRGCALEASFACFVAAALTSDTDASFQLLAKACDLGDGEACTSFGASLLAGAGVPQDGPRAVKVLERGCRLGDPRACRALGGALLSSVPGVPPDDAKAAKALARSCDGGDLSGCAVLGVAYAGGRGVAKDVKRANELFHKACDQGTTEATATGCFYLGLSHLKGEGAPQSYSESAKYFELACNLKWGEACAALANQYEAGQGVKADLDKAAELNHQACELNHVPACTKDRKAP